MPRHRDDPDPIRERRRQLAEQERLVAEQRRRLTEQMQTSADAAAKPAGPLVWRTEEDGPVVRAAEPTPARRRNLARQRQRDMFLFFVFSLLLLVLVVIFCIAYLHNTASGRSA